MIDGITGVDMREIDQRADEESSYTHQEQGEGDLRSNKKLAGAQARRSECGPILESVQGINARGTQSWQQAREHSGNEGDGQRETQHAQIKRRVIVQSVRRVGQ